MNKTTLLALVTAVNFLSVPPAMAEVGVTDACQDDVKELKEKIKDNKDDYTAESRRKAKRQLTAAQTNRLNLAKCRGNIHDARKELKQGKRDKKKED